MILTLRNTQRTQRYALNRLLKILHTSDVVLNARAAAEASRTG